MISQCPFARFGEREACKAERYEVNAMAPKNDRSISDEVRAKTAHANGKMKRTVYEKELFAGYRIG